MTNEIVELKVKEKLNFQKKISVLKITIVSALENTYNDSKVKYEKLRLQVDSLKLKTVKLKDDIYNKLNFFSTGN